MFPTFPFQSTKNLQISRRPTLQPPFHHPFLFIQGEAKVRHYTAKTSPHLPRKVDLSPKSLTSFVAGKFLITLLCRVAAPGVCLFSLTARNNRSPNPRSYEFGPDTLPRLPGKKLSSLYVDNARIVFFSFRQRNCGRWKFSIEAFPRLTGLTEMSGVVNNPFSWIRFGWGAVHRIGF